MLLHKDREQFEAILNAVSNELSIPVSIVEKDYYVRVDYNDAISVIAKIIKSGMF